MVTFYSLISTSHKHEYFLRRVRQFKLAHIVQKNDTTYQVDTQFGKRTKIKTNNVFLEFDGDMAQFMQQAEAHRDDIDTDLLWEVCGDAELSAEDIAIDYFGGKPSKSQLAGTYLALYAAPAYFYKKAKGIFKAAPEETLKQALAAIERKKQQEAQMAAWSESLQAVNCRKPLLRISKPFYTRLTNKP